MKIRSSRLHVAIDTGDGPGPVVVLVHGIASSATTFQNVIPLLESTHRVIAVDLLGFGGSIAPDTSTFTLDEHVSALRQTLASLKLNRPFVLVGHSMGALIVARYAAERPDPHLAHVVLVSPPFYVPAPTLANAADRAAMQLHMNVYEFLRKNKDFTIRTASILSRMLPIKNVITLSERNWAAFTLSLRNVIESQTSLDDLAHVRTKVDIVYGAWDPFVMPTVLEIVGQLKNVTVHRDDVSDHLIKQSLARAVVSAIEVQTQDPRRASARSRRL